MAKSDKVRQFNKAECRTVAGATEMLLQEWAADHGLQVESKGGSYTDGSYTMKLEWSIVGEDGVAVTKAMEDWHRYAAMYDLDPGWLGKEFTSRGRTYTISGFAPRSRKYPVLAARDDGKTYKFTPEIVKRSFAAPAPKLGFAIPRSAKGKARAAKAAKKPAKSGTIGATAEDAILQGMTNQEALEIVLQAHPNASTKLASMNWYRNKLRKEGKAV